MISGSGGDFGGNSLTRLAVVAAMAAAVAVPEVATSPRRCAWRCSISSSRGLLDVFGFWRDGGTPAAVLTTDALRRDTVCP